MPTTTRQRRTQNGNYNSVYARSYNRTYSSAAERYDYPMSYPRHNAKNPTIQNPEIKKPRPAANTTQVKSGVKSRGRKLTFKVFAGVACIFAMCCILLYRNAVILESNDRITKMKSELAAAESSKQAVQAKIDKELELGKLESYAKTNLGMVYPDNSQILYIDMQLGDGAQTDAQEEQKKSELALKGTPGALVHAIQVLK